MPLSWKLSSYLSGNWHFQFENLSLTVPSKQGSHFSLNFSHWPCSFSPLPLSSALPFKIGYYGFLIAVWRLVNTTFDIPFGKFSQLRRIIAIYEFGSSVAEEQ